MALYLLRILGLPRTHGSSVSSSLVLELQGVPPYPDYSASFTGSWWNGSQPLSTVPFTQTCPFTKCNNITSARPRGLAPTPPPSPPLPWASGPLLPSHCTWALNPRQLPSCEPTGAPDLARGPPGGAQPSSWLKSAKSHLSNPSGNKSPSYLHDQGDSGHQRTR